MVNPIARLPVRGIPRFVITNTGEKLPLTLSSNPGICCVAFARVVRIPSD
jgi:hypothetical protein